MQIGVVAPFSLILLVDLCMLLAGVVACHFVFHVCTALDYFNHCCIFTCTFSPTCRAEEGFIHVLVDDFRAEVNVFLKF